MFVGQGSSFALHRARSLIVAVQKRRSGARQGEDVDERENDIEHDWILKEPSIPRSRRPWCDNRPCPPGSFHRYKGDCSG
jgi:hypothetical protein